MFTTLPKHSKVPEYTQNNKQQSLRTLVSIGGVKGIEGWEETQRKGSHTGVKANTRGTELSRKQVI